MSNSIKRQKRSKHFIEYLDNVVRPLIFILSKMNGYVKTFKNKDKYNKMSGSAKLLNIIN